MKNFGWDEIINRVNARIEGITVNLKQDETQTPAKQSPEAPGQPITEADQRDAAIEAFCGKIGVPMGIARKYRFDIRPLHRITNDILKRSVESRAVARGGSWIR